jgi:transposase
MGYYKGILIEKNIEEIKKLISDGTPLMEIARKYSIKYDTLVRHLKRLGVNYTTNQHRTGRPHYESRISVMWYIENNKYLEASRLRKKLIEEGIKENKCERCGITEWMGGDVPLELHHLDENHFNNNLDNLVILCSNCHAQIHGYNKTTSAEAKNHKEKIKKAPKKKGENKETEKRYCVVCGKELKNEQKKFCSHKCLHAYTGKRPSYEEIIALRNNGIDNVHIAEKYGVTEASVRKWFKKYEIENNKLV